MRMNKPALFATGFLTIIFGLQNSARCQTNILPPKAIAKPSAPLVTAKDAPVPRHGADYDGFTPGIDEERVPLRRPRAANRPKPKHGPDATATQQSVDQDEDEKLSRKLTICRNCK